MSRSYHRPQRPHLAERSTPANLSQRLCALTFIASWTDFFGPLIYLSNQQKYTLQLGLYNFFGQHMVDWPGFMAASLWVLAPVAILFFLTQKTFIEGITFTGIKA